LLHQRRSYTIEKRVNVRSTHICILGSSST
jgi:hypothetical protein